MKTDVYTTRLGTEFEFGFESRNGRLIIHIFDQPSYRYRDDNPHVIHVVHENGNRIVCWSDPVPTLKDAKIIAGLWADFTERYIMTGEHFPETRTYHEEAETSDFIPQGY